MSFAALINGSPSRFLSSFYRALAGCPLSPFLFLIVAEALNRIIHEQGSKGKIRGVKVYDKESISHLLLEMTFSLLKEFLDLYCKATGMEINYRKFFLINCHKPLSFGWMKSSLSLERIYM
jgi:hypothetical protein